MPITSDTIRLEQAARAAALCAKPQGAAADAVNALRATLAAKRQERAKRAARGA